MMSPPASDSGSGSPPQFSPYCVDSEPGSPILDHDPVKCEPDSPSSVGVMDRSRLLLCALTFFCLSLNPLPSLLGSDATGSPSLPPGHGSSRTLFSFPSPTQDFGEFLGYIGKMFNATVDSPGASVVLQHPGCDACCRG